MSMGKSDKSKPMNQSLSVGPIPKGNSNGTPTPEGAINKGLKASSKHGG